MNTLILNTVKTERGDYTFSTREQAEAFFIAVSLRDRERGRPGPSPEQAEAAAGTAPARSRRHPKIR